MKKLITVIILVLVLILLFRACRGPATSDLHGLVKEDATCFVGVDAGAVAEFLKPHHKMADKYLPDVAPVVDEMLTKDFYKSMELLDPKMFTVVGKGGEDPVVGLRMDDEIPFGTLLRGFSPLVEHFGIGDDFEITQPDEDENLFLAAEDEDVLEAAKKDFGRKGAKLARKRLSGIDYNKCLIYGWLDTKAAMGLVGSAAGFLPFDADMAEDVCKEAGTLRFGVKPNGKWKLNIVFIGSFENKDKATEVADGLKGVVKQGIDELKEQVGQADGTEKDTIKLELDTLKGVKVKRSGNDVRLEANINLKSLWKIAKKFQKEEQKANVKAHDNSQPDAE